MRGWCHISVVMFRPAVLNKGRSLPQEESGSALALNDETESGRRRRYYWHCPQCRAYVPREQEQCECGALKAERRRGRAEAAADQPRAADAWRLIMLVVLSSFGLLWVLLD